MVYHSNTFLLRIITVTLFTLHCVYGGNEFYLLPAQCSFMIPGPNDSPLPCPVPPLTDDLLRNDNFTMFGLLSVDTETNYTKIEIYGTGFPFFVPITAWFITLPIPLGSPHPIFKYHHRSFPVAATTACYNSGRSGFEINQFIIDTNGDGQLIQTLDFNPILPFQSPLPNELTPITQEAYPSIIGDINNNEFVYGSLKQNTLQKSQIIQPIHREFLREYNADGTQKLDENGLPVLTRLHLPIYMMAVVVHIDRMTHGLSSGIFNPNIINDINVGDHYELGQFVFENKIKISKQEKKRFVKKYKSDIKWSDKSESQKYTADVMLFNPVPIAIDDNSVMKYNYEKYTFFIVLIMFVMNVAALIYLIHCFRTKKLHKNKTII